MAHGSLGHAQFLSGSREAYVAGGRLESLERVELWQTPRHRFHLMKKSHLKGARLCGQAAFISGKQPAVRRVMIYGQAPRVGIKTAHSEKANTPVDQWNDVPRASLIRPPRNVD